ncbi:alpha/beta-hydrolase [Panus rudis PR-1116 ss-1]|nr:alpha/beta-hydrolase [Panus rudis PR-1116 ss-1]
MYEYRSQPWKTLYLTYQVITTPLIRIPLWIAYYIPHSTRPRPSWSLKRTIVVKLIKHLGYISTKVGKMNLGGAVHNHLVLDDGASVKGAWIAPTPHLITGDVKKWAADAGVECMRIPGYWLEKEGTSRDVGAPPLPGEKVLYALHGGGYANNSAHPDDITSNIARGLLKHVPSIQRAFSVEYRLTTGPPEEIANPFPAALLDAIAGYNYLVNEVGFSPRDIILEGDSAGANLALALVRYLVENNNTSPDIHLPDAPGNLILCAPWGDIGDSTITPGSSAYKNADSDYINMLSERYKQLRKDFAGPLGIEATNTNRYISPASVYPGMENVSFKGFPRTFITAGGAEVLVDTIRNLRDKMVQDLGEAQIEYFEAPDGIHDYLVMTWHELERTETLRRISAWLSTI